MFFFSCSSDILESTPELQHHVDGIARFDGIAGEFGIILQLLSRENQPNLVLHDPFLLLQGILDSSNLVRGLKSVPLLSACQSLDENLHAS